MKEDSKWRRAGDSNPRNPRRFASFQDWCIQPLCQLSVDQFMGRPCNWQEIGQKMRGLMPSEILGFEHSLAIL